MSKSATLKDVAKRAGVSTATVARVLHDSGYVASKTRQRVEAALAETEYQLNVVAQGLRKQQTFTIGHVLHAITENPFFAQVAVGVEDVALKHGYNVFIINVHGKAAREQLAVESFIGRRVDAVIFTTANDPKNVQRVVDAGIPVVQVERITEVETSAVLIDNYSGAKEAMNYLLSLGHTKIGFIGGDPALIAKGRKIKRTVETERLAAYVDALKEHHIAKRPELMRLGKYYSLENGGFHGEGYYFMKALLSEDITAVFASCDVLAAGALQAIHEAGLRVPDDLSIIGFDDTLAAHLTPPLTTVSIPMHQVGRVAAELAFAAIEGGTQPVNACLKTQLNVRASVARPKI
jgi:LacI family transcriptional regulator